MSTVTTPRRLGDLLIEHGYLERDQLEGALEHQASGGNTRLLGEILVDLELCTEDEITECLALEFGIPYAKLEPRLHDPAVLELLPRDFIEKNLVLPLFCVRRRPVKPGSTTCWMSCAK